MSLSNTPSANRVHISLYGKRNSGKSSLINAITNQDIALVSDYAGTTTDPVYKAMEIHGIGPCMLIDTAGFDDEGELGRLRVEKTRQALEKTDIAIMVFDGSPITQEKEWISLMKKKKTPILAVVNKADLLDNADAFVESLERDYGLSLFWSVLKPGRGSAGFGKSSSVCCRRIMSRKVLPAIWYPRMTVCFW